MKREEFEKIFDNEDTDWEGDNALKGLKIIEKYMSGKTLICGAGHDVIYSVDIDELIGNGITLEDAEALRQLNWMLDEADCMSCFV